MASSNGIARLAVTLALAAGCSGALAQVHKCTDAQGKTTYQQKPCESGAAAGTAPNAQRTATAPPASAARPLPVATLMKAVVRCSEQWPAFADKIQPNYVRWSEANTDAVQNFQRTPDYGRMLSDARKERAASGGRMSPELVEECKKTEDYFAQNWGAAR